LECSLKAVAEAIMGESIISTRKFAEDAVRYSAQLQNTVSTVNPARNLQEKEERNYDV